MSRIREFLQQLNILSPLRKLAHYEYAFEWEWMTSIAKRLQERKLRKTQNASLIRVVFFVIEEASWKFEEVYRRMVDDERFEVNVLVCPIVNRGREYMLKTMKRSYEWFIDNGYNTTIAYDEDTNQYVNAKKRFNPDIVFFTDPYFGLIDKRYYISKYLDRLTIYAPYAFSNTSNLDFGYNQLLHNLVWRFYLETPTQKEYAKSANLVHGRNVVVTGYPGIEKLINGYVPADNPWKEGSPRLKKIIWAPHWTIQQTGGIINFSCFLSYADGMLALADKYREKVMFCFKPHPLLRVQLEQVWGKKKTDDYFWEWEHKTNAFLCVGAYDDLFLTSDAMIHDSGSFINEYLYVGKPVMRTMKHGISLDMYDSFTKSSLEHYYKAYGIEDVERFIVDVINDHDPMKTARMSYVYNYMMPNNGRLPSENIMDDIVDSIDHRVLYRE